MKRFAAEYPARKAEKRTKHSVEDLWCDSDPDIDDCLLRASQIADAIPQIQQQDTITQSASESILTYNAFNKTAMLASTQLDQSVWVHPTASTSILPNKAQHNHAIVNNSESEEQKLRAELVSREGEISILRAQLKQSREQTDQINSKRMNQTLEKLQSMKKERDKFSTEVDFKNLEIVNLKQKLANITKNMLDNTTTMDDNATLHDTRQSAEVTKGSCGNQVANCEEAKRFEPISGTKYPLQYVIPVNIFESHENDKFPKLLHSKLTTDERYLHSLTFSNEQTNEQQNKGVFTYIQYGKTLKMKHFFGAIRFLQGANECKLENETTAINQIYLLTLTLLTNHVEYLTKFAKLVQKDEIREFDLKNLQNPNRHFDVDVSLLMPINCDSSIEECAMQCRQCVALLAAIYPHNIYLRTLINKNKSPCTTEREREMWPFAFNEIFSSGNEANLLKNLYRIVMLIADTRRGNSYTGLLCSICDLLTEIIQINHENIKVYELIGKLIMQILLTAPAYSVLYYLSKLFKCGSNIEIFIQQLCTNQPSNAQKKNTKGIVLVSHTCCIIEVYFNLCRQALSHLAFTQSNDFRMHLNLVQFVHNSINSNVRWMHIEPDKNTYSCVKEYYKLTIEVIYTSLSTYAKLRTQNKEIPVEVQTIVRIAPHILGTLVHKYAELIEINLQYNAMLKSSQALLKESRDRFNGWNEFELETIAKLTIHEPTSQATPSMDKLSTESLKFS